MFKNILKYLKYIYWIIGIVMLIMILSKADITEVFSMSFQIGITGLICVFILYLSAFLIDSFTWHLTITSAPITWGWFYSAFKARMAGEAFNYLIPAGGMGGEPLKAQIMNKHYGISYNEAVASLVIAKTINMIALVIFLIPGFIAMLYSPNLGNTYKTIAILGLTAFTLAILIFFILQRTKIISSISTKLSRKPWGHKLNAVLHHIEEFDYRLVNFYTNHKSRLIVAIIMAWINWLFGIAELYVIGIFLASPIDIFDAWIAESAIQLVRAGIFFIPASIGVQEGTFLLTYAALIGSAEIGLAAAMVRRAREILWVICGLVIGAIYTRTPPRNKILGNT